MSDDADNFYVMFWILFTGTCWSWNIL